MDETKRLIAALDKENVRLSCLIVELKEQVKTLKEMNAIQRREIAWLKVKDVDCKEGQ